MGRGRLQDAVPLDCIGRPPMKHQIDILFATYNGARTLPDMFAALAALEPPSRPIRIIAVNNGSSDHTGAILSEWAARLPMIVVDGPGTGKVPGQQAGRPFLEGDLVVLADDDIRPERDWLVRLEAAADAHPDAGIFGGEIVPVPIDEVSPWYEAARDYEGDLFGRTRAPRGPVCGADTIFGPNLMMRLEHARSGLAEAIALGPSPAGQNGRRTFPLGDESEMIARLERAGVKSFFVPEARVGHMVRGFQTELGFMLQRAQNHGRGVALRSIGGASDLMGRGRIACSSGLTAAWILSRAWSVSRKVPDRQGFNTLYGLNWHTGRLKGALTGPFAG